MANKKAQLAELATILALVVLIAGALLVSEFRITGYAALNLSDVSDYDESIRLEFSEAGTKVVYLNFDNYNYIATSFDVSGLAVNQTIG